MRIVFFGTPDFSVLPLKYIADNHDVVLVVSQPDSIRSRGKKLLASPVKQAATQLSIEVFTPEKVNSSDAIEYIKGFNADVFVVVAYGQILSEELLSLPKLGSFNIHASLLPTLRGAAPIQQAILTGEKTSGITIMEMAKGLDSGDILLKRELDIRGMTADELHDKLMTLGSEMIIEALNNLEELYANKIPQEHSKATYAHKITKDMARLDFTKSSAEIVNKTLAFDSFPGAFCYIEEAMIKFFSPVAANGYGEEGEILFVSTDYIEVACGQGSVKFYEIQYPGKKRMKVKDFLSGHKFDRSIKLG